MAQQAQALVSQLHATALRTAMRPKPKSRPASTDTCLTPVKQIIASYHDAVLIEHKIEEDLADADPYEAAFQQPQRLRSRSFSDFSSPVASNLNISTPVSSRDKKRLRNNAATPTNAREGVDTFLAAHYDHNMSTDHAEIAQPASDQTRGEHVYMDLSSLHNARHDPWSPMPSDFAPSSHDNHPPSHTPLLKLPQTPGVDDMPVHGITAAADFGNASIGITGLKNLGNTCFMNAALQCLSATVPLALFLRSGAYKRLLNRVSKLGSQGIMARALARLFNVMWSQEHSHVTPLAVRDAVWQFAPNLEGPDQQDAQEVMAFFLDSLHEDLNLVLSKPDTTLTAIQSEQLETMHPLLASQQEWERSLRRDNSVVSAWCHGQERSRLQCLVCKATSTTWSNYSMLSLAMPLMSSHAKTFITLEMLLDAYLQPEQLPASEGWCCHRCKTARPAIKTIQFTRFPPILMFHISRTMVSDDGLADKDDRPVRFPIYELDLGPYMSPPPCDGRLIYRLYAMICHVGGADYGHYTAIVSSPSHNDWYLCNDQKITKLSGSRDIAKHYRSCYMLCYRLKN